jgi:hypothetical protein
MNPSTQVAMDRAVIDANNQITAYLDALIQDQNLDDYERAMLAYTYNAWPLAKKLQCDLSISVAQGFPRNSIVDLVKSAPQGTTNYENTSAYLRSRGLNSLYQYTQSKSPTPFINESMSAGIAPYLVIVVDRGEKVLRRRLRIKNFTQVQRAVYFLDSPTTVQLAAYQKYFHITDDRVISIVDLPDVQPRQTQRTYNGKPIVKGKDVQEPWIERSHRTWKFPSFNMTGDEAIPKELINHAWLVGLDLPTVTLTPSQALKADPVMRWDYLLQKELESTHWHDDALPFITYVALTQSYHYSDTTTRHSPVALELVRRIWPETILPKTHMDRYDSVLRALPKALETRLTTILTHFKSLAPMVFLTTPDMELAYLAQRPKVQFIP